MKNSTASARDIIYKEILDKIQYCEWAPGTLISEPKLSELFGLSRTPVREALHVLEQEGFVEIVPQSGSFVSKIDLKRIREILFLRYHLELPILEELAAEKAAIPETVSRLMEGMERETAAENWKEAVRLDYCIHEELIRFAGYEHIWKIIGKELPHYTRFRFFEPKHGEFRGANPRSIGEHKAILTYIGRGDTEGLRSVLQSHYDFTLVLRREYNTERIGDHADYFVNLQLLDPGL